MAGFDWARRWVGRLRDGRAKGVMDVYPYRFAMQSDPGRVRKGNEDACRALPEHGAFVVCDGMGGAAAGEVASKVAAEAFLAALVPVRRLGKRGELRSATAEVRLDEAVRAANTAVYEDSQRSVQLHGMGTTLVGVLLEVDKESVERPSLTLVHVGDSRCYVYRKQELILLTSDHSLVEEQVQLGELSVEEAAVHPMRNIITRAVGSQPVVEPETRSLQPEPGDIYMLASDGLTRELTEAEVAEAFRRAVSHVTEGRPDLEKLCGTLIEKANDAGGGDNITVLLLQLP